VDAAATRTRLIPAKQLKALQQKIPLKRVVTPRMWPSPLEKLFFDGREKARVGGAERRKSQAQRIGRKHWLPTTQ
jgi:hypothetical protein